MVCTIIEKVDSNVTLINLDQSKAFYRVNYSFLEAVLSVIGFSVTFAAGFTFSMHPLESWWKWGKIKALHFDSVDSSRLSSVTHAVHPYTGTIPAQVEGKPGPILPQVNWHCQGGQVHCSFVFQYF